MHIVAVVGMAGAGKTELSHMLEKSGWTRLRFGDATDDELRRLGLPRTEKNEREVRERLRREHGMAAYAKLIVPKIESADRRKPVVLDGMYSWEEYLTLHEKYGDDLIVLAVYTTRKIRYQRLSEREIRPLTVEEAKSRDVAEIEKLNKAGPIALADYTLMNDGSVADLETSLDRFLAFFAISRKL